MTPSPPRGPQDIRGMVPTLNNTGFMSMHMNGCVQAFVDFASTCTSEVLDMGCAFGIATHAALATGARVLACDMEPRHLDAVTEQTPLDERSRLRTQAATLPGAEFPDGSFGAILCSRVIHFLTGPDIEQSITKFHRWLAPGGKLFLITDTPYSGYWKAHAPIYEEKKRAGELWPGFIADTSVYLPASSTRSSGFLNPCDPEILERVCREAGFVIESAAYIGRVTESGATPLPDARDHAAVIARKDQP
ncbi:MAG: class I SAM-dependent methyltransferase [Rhodobacteraceae bacterium]|nr:class I SAM-dependent methyltransferase [Paracoccaceae bacterium]